MFYFIVLFKLCRQFEWPGVAEAVTVTHLLSKCWRRRPTNAMVHVMSCQQNHDTWAAVTKQPQNLLPTRYINSVYLSTHTHTHTRLYRHTFITHNAAR